MSMLNKLREQRDAAVAEAEALLAGEPTAEALDTVSARHEDIKNLDERIAVAEAVEARAAQIAESREASGVKPYSAAVVTREAMTYEKHGDHSFVRDMIGATLRNDRGAWERLHRHQQEATVELRNTPNRTDGQGGEFVPPLWLLNDYAEFARAARVAADLVTTQALPAGTDSINIPRITLGTATGFQSADNAATTTRNMTTATVTAPVRTITGYEDVAIQLVDQSPLAGGLDRLIFGDLSADHAFQLNAAVLGNGDGTSGGLRGLVNIGANSTDGLPVTWTETTPSAANGYKAVTQAISKIATTRFRPADAVVMSPKTWYWFVGQVDSAGRPFVVPTAAGPFNAGGVVTEGGASAGLVGTMAGIPVYLDASMPTVNTDQLPIVVARFSDSHLFESGLRTRVLPDIGSANLTVRFQVYSYVALAHRFGKSISAITGTGAVGPTGY